MPPRNPSIHNLHALRVWRGLTLRQLAQACGVSYQSVQNWEAGHRNPTPTHRARLAEVLGVGEEVLRTPDPVTAMVVAFLRDPHQESLTPEARQAQHARWVALVQRLRAAES